MSVKTAGILLIAAGILLLGREWEKRKTDCVREMEYFYRFLRYLEQEITCRQTLLLAALERSGPYVRGLAHRLSQQLMACLETRQEPFGQIWEELTEDIYGGMGLAAEELQVMKQAGAAFAFAQKEMIGSQTGLDQACLWRLLEERRERLRRDCHLSRCLSVMASLFVILILI